MKPSKRPQFVFLVCLVALLPLTACSGDGYDDNGGLQTSPPIASTLSVGFSPKLLQFTWTTATGAATYRLLENPDGTSTFAQVGADVAAPATSSNLDIAVYRKNWAAARYALDACNAAGCTRSNEVTISAGMAAAIGYFKASNTGGGDQFGCSVALSSDGNTLAVGARVEDSNATGIGGNQADNSAVDSGAVYVFTRTAGVWSQQAYVKASNSDGGDLFSSNALALSSDGNTLAVGASNEDSNATGIGGNQADNSALTSGAAYVFTRTAGVWSQQAYVKASNTEGGDFFSGINLALSSDGNTLAVGAISEDSNATGIGGNQADNSAVNSGAVYVFTRAAGVWSQQAYVKASNTEGGDDFGFSMALSSDGNTLAVGARAEDSNATGSGGNQADNSAVDSGAVYVFTRTAGVWSQQAYVKASNTEGGDDFGFSMALSSDGNTLAVGATDEDSNATGIGGNQADNSAALSGAVYVFTRASGVWSQQAYVKASNTGAGDGLGGSVALSSDGNALAVGASGEDSNATGIGGNQADNSALTSGAVYVFTRNAGVWSQQAYVKASNTEGGDGFGFRISFTEGNTLAVGALNEDSNAMGIGGNQADNSAVTSGALYLY